MFIFVAQISQVAEWYDTKTPRAESFEMIDYIYESYKFESCPGYFLIT